MQASIQTIPAYTTNNNEQEQRQQQRPEEPEDHEEQEVAVQTTLAVAPTTGPGPGPVIPQNTNNTARIRSATPWYLSHSLFLAILMIRVMRHGSARSIVPWWLTFSPLFLSATTVMLIKARESYEVLKTRRETTPSLSFRVHCALVDHIGYTMTMVMTCLYLETSFIPNVALVCSPLLLTAVMSLIHRLINLPSLHSRTIGQLFFSSFLNCLLHSFVKIIQPVFLVLKLDSHVEMPWTVVASPTWVLCFGGLVAVVLLIYFSCILHTHANVVLRIHASKLMLLCAFQVLLVSLCTFLSSYWLATALDSDSNISVMTHLSIFLPLVGMCITIAICYPITLANSTRYHELLLASTQVYIAMQSARRVVLAPMDENTTTWLIQESDSLFRLTTPATLGINTVTELTLRQQSQPFVMIDGDTHTEKEEDICEKEEDICVIEKMPRDIETGLCVDEEQNQNHAPVMYTSLRKDNTEALITELHSRSVETQNQTQSLSVRMTNGHADYRDVTQEEEKEDVVDEETNREVKEDNDEEKEKDDEEEAEAEEEDEDSRLSLSSSSSASVTLSLVDLVIDKQLSLLTGTSHTDNHPRPYPPHMEIYNDHDNNPDTDRENENETMKKNNEPKLDGHMCIICYDCPANACFMNCGHGNVCYDCALTVAKKAPSQCPICRLSVEQVLKLTQYVDVDMNSLVENDYSSTTTDRKSPGELSTTWTGKASNSCTHSNETEIVPVSSSRTSSSHGEVVPKEGMRLVLSDEGVNVVSQHYHAQQR